MAGVHRATDSWRRPVPFSVDGERTGALSNGIPNGTDSRPSQQPVGESRMVNGYPTPSRSSGSSSKPKKQLILNAFVEMCSGHQSPGLWRHPDDESHNFTNIHHWIKLAQMLERGKFNGIFIADVLGVYDVYGGPKNLSSAVRSGAQMPVDEPLCTVPAMAAATSSLGFGVTVTTTYEEPYHLARRISTADHLTGGRVGWNVVTGYLDSAARNMGHTEQPEHDERYRIAEEYMEVMYKLWNSSWRDDAVVRDPNFKLGRGIDSRGKEEVGLYSHPDRVREINHKGKYYQVPGPHICSPSPQRTPLILQAGASKAGQAFAAKHAEAIFVSGHSPISVAKSVKAIREQAAQEGRDPQSVKFLCKITPVLGRTKEEAEAKYEEYLSYGSYEGALALFGGWTGVDMAQYGEEQELNLVETNAIRSYIEGLMKHAPNNGRGTKWTKKVLAEHIMVGGLGATPVGTPEMVADEFERWMEEADVDGFNICYAVLPQSFKDVIEILIPELQRRGLFWQDYAVPGGTYRENFYATLGQREPQPNHPASAYIWRADDRVGANRHKMDTPFTVPSKARSQVVGSASANDSRPSMSGLSSETLKALNERRATVLDLSA